MAIKVTKSWVCDFGELHKGEVEQWRITLDGETKLYDLCASCAKPLKTLWDKGPESRPVPARMRVHTMSEIEASKRKTPPSR